MVLDFMGNPQNCALAKALVLFWVDKNFLFLFTFWYFYMFQVLKCFLTSALCS